MQCKDVPDQAILAFLAKNIDKWHCSYSKDFDNSIRHAMPEGVQTKLVLAKMRQMIKRGVVKGCACGCRGDFVITEKGLKELADAG